MEVQLSAVYPDGCAGVRAQVVPDDRGWSIFIPGLPLAADGASLDAVLDEMILALREYAEDWRDGLREAPNHERAKDVVGMVGRAGDAELREWLVGSERPENADAGKR